ncbi:MAG TPA: hypothetical protein VL361_09415 [Candidatus Limnocylindrales bacterium]|jgi:hypothetical protein|nr:hypothetical protein [Candidatus Limnocylindrales bacterium]
MKDDPAKDELLSDLLGEAATPSFRESSLDQMLAAVQQRRVRRRRVQALATAASLFLIVALGVRFFPKHNVMVARQANPMRVHSAPLTPGSIVTTEASLIGSVNSLGTSIALVEEIPASELYERIGDDKLLALLTSRPAALVYRSTSTAELVFLNPADADGFQLH